MHTIYCEALCLTAYPINGPSLRAKGFDDHRIELMGSTNFMNSDGLDACLPSFFQPLSFIHPSLSESIDSTLLKVAVPTMTTYLRSRNNAHRLLNTWFVTLVGNRGLPKGTVQPPRML